MGKTLVIFQRQWFPPAGGVVVPAGSHRELTAEQIAALPAGTVEPVSRMAEGVDLLDVAAKAVEPTAAECDLLAAAAEAVDAPADPAQAEPAKKKPAKKKAAKKKPTTADSS